MIWIQNKNKIIKDILMKRNYKINKQNNKEFIQNK